MDEQTLLLVIGGLLTVLLTLLGWMGNRLYLRVSEMSTTMSNLHVDLLGQMSTFDHRLTVVEVQCKDRHHAE